MYANNEIGTIQPVGQIGAVCRTHGVIFHTDAVQAVGHLPINVQEENIDMLSCLPINFMVPRKGSVRSMPKGHPAYQPDRRRRAGTRKAGGNGKRSGDYGYGGGV